MNKKIIIIVLLLVSTAVLATVQAYAMDYPHNEAKSVACEDCHYIWGSEPSLMLEGLTYGLNIDDTNYNALCWSCHDTITAPLVATHSSLQIDNGYGDWSFECLDCHDVHGNYQFRIFGSASYIFQGTISSVNATTLTLTGAGWTDNQFQDLVLIPNVAWDYNNYKITGNTIDTLTVAGTIDLTRANPGDTFAIIYGKLIKETINTPSSGAKTVRFFDSSGTNSFADGDGTLDGVCEVCHTQTTHHRNNVSGDHAHNAGLDCMTCHQHTKGFKTACDICHGNPPVVNTATGGPDGLVNAAGVTGSSTAGAHNLHVNTKSFSCTVCHYDSAGTGPTHNNGQTVTMGFYLFNGAYQGGTYDGQSGVSYNNTTTVPVTSTSSNNNKTCSSIYCHSSGQSTVSGSSSTPAYALPVWDNPASGTCGTCHEKDVGSVISGSHDAHLGTTGVQGCGECHTGAENDASAYNSSSHINTLIEVANSYTAGGTPGNGYGKCSTGRCHDDGLGNPKNTPDWGTPGGGCSECHLDVPSTGSHVKHVTTTNYNTADCSDCHDGAVRDTTAPAQHLDEDIDVYDSSPGDLGYPQDVVKGGTPYNSCSTAYCHSTGQSTTDGNSSTPTYATVTWGDSAACGTCHEVIVGSVTSGSHDEHLNATGVNGCGDCHTDAADNASSYNSANHVNKSIDVANTYSAGDEPGNGYGECSAASCHEDGTGTMVDSPTWGTVVNDCSECHAKKPTTGSHTNHLTTATSHGYKRPTCGNCHDGAVEGTTAPAQHLDGDVDVYDADPEDLGYPQDETKGGAPYKTCSTAYCHSSGQSYTNQNDPTPTYATATWGGGEVCGFCHKAETSHNFFAQTIDSGSHTPHLAYTFNLGGNATKCTLCHKWEASQPFGACNQCHGSAGANTYHANGEINVFLDTEFGPRTAYGDQTGVPGNGYYDCSNTYCHSNATGGTSQAGDPRAIAANTSPDWGTSGPLSCDSCHDGTAAGPAYANGSPKANSHASHTALYSCETCHDKTVDGINSIISTTWHLNSRYDVSGTLIDSYTYAADGGTCSAAACHGGATQKWGDNSTGKDECTKCHGTLTDSPAPDYAKAPPQDTAGDTGAGDAQVGAHQAHLQSSLANDVACNECHTVPSAVSDAEHINDATPGTAELNFGSLASTGTASPDYTGGVCSSVYCHGGAMPRGGTDGADETPTWSNTSYLNGNAANDCSRCHGYPPSAIAAHSGKGPTDCITCHNYGVNAAGTGFTDPSNHINGTLDGGGDNCYDCHSSSGGPTPGTTPDTPHARHIQQPYVGKVSTGDYGKVSNGWYFYENNGGVPNKGCGYCHPQSSATHMNGTINLNFDPADTGAAGTMKAKNNPTQSYTQVPRTNVTCSSVYCHSSGYFDGSSYQYKTSPNWYGGLFTDITPDKCNACHGNKPDTSSHVSHGWVGIHYNTIFDGTSGLLPDAAASGAGHGDPSTSTTINCYICHNNVVKMAANDKNTACAVCHGVTASLQGTMVIDPSSTSHVTGTADINFADITFRSKAQIRDDITTVTELNTYWVRGVNDYKQGPSSHDSSKQTLFDAASYDSGTSTCSTVACHNGVAITWDTNISTCAACHIDVPRTDQ